LEIFLTILYSLFFIFLIYRIGFYHIEGFTKKAVVFVFLIKILAGIGMYFIYTYYYTDRSTADIFKYFDDSKVMYDALWNKPADFFRMVSGIQNDTTYFDQYYHQMHNWYRVFESNIYNDSHTIIRINALMRIFSFGYFNVHTVFMCFLSLTGLVGLYRFFIPFMKDKKRLLFFSVFLIPSVVFWGSGVLKEAILLFGMGMFLYAISGLLNKKSIIRNIILLLISIILLMLTKYYVCILIVPLSLAFVWCKLTSEKYIYLKYGVIVVACIALGMNMHHINPDLDMLKILAMKQNDFVGLAQAMNSGSLISNDLLQPTAKDFIIHTPSAFYNTLVRPYIFEAGSVIVLFAALENLLILFLLIVSLLFISKKTQHKSVLVFCLLFFMALYILTGLTTPIFGALVRYKVPAMPFLMVFIFMLMNQEKLLIRFPVLRKILR